ncbi:MAG: hypothetical protein JNG86_01720 [Verrucomicrobiaceae bacterium]|nr:hypothetical protein [Verrucomicrobiaceae bacterium]
MQRDPTGAAPAPALLPVVEEDYEQKITPGGGAGIVLAFAPAMPPPAVFTPASMTPAALPRPVTAPQAAFPNTQEIRVASHAPTTHLTAPPMHVNGVPDTGNAMQEVIAQVEQMRNDLFAAATTLSALSDRLERLESRPVAVNGHQAEVASLRSDIERWICHHLEAAVEQSMRRIWERSHAASQPPPAQAHA